MPPYAAACTIPARLARPTISSTSLTHASFRSRSLYRTWYRSAPEITQLYALNVPASAIRAKIRGDFERNREVKDLKTLDVLLSKGWMEYQETVNCWKMESQIMRWFAKEEVGLSCFSLILLDWKRKEIADSPLLASFSIHVL